jgi:hypothetical protein
VHTASPVGEEHVSALLSNRSWAHVTPRTRALGWDFAVRTNVPALGRHLDVIFDAMRADGEPSNHYSFVVDERRGWTRHRVYRDGNRILDSPDPGRAFLYLLWDINQRVFRTSPDKLLVHAACVEHEGRALIMSAPSESGKTTLALGLVERGLGYLTDEAAAIDPETLLVHPFPKALSVDVGAQRFLGRFEPAADRSLDDYLRGQWQVAPNRIRPGAVAAPVEPAWFIVPRYVNGGDTTLAPLARAEALSLLMEQGLNLHHNGRYGFERLGEIVRRSRCFMLIMSDLGSACDAVLRMLDEGPLDA